MDQTTDIVEPFLKRGPNTARMMLAMLACLTVTAVHFAVRYDGALAWRFAAALGIGWLIELTYALLRDGRPAWPNPSTAVTSALLVLSVPSRMPLPHIAAGIAVATLFGKLMIDRTALRLNPMLLGRLFMMLVFADSIQRWSVPGAAPDALSYATPLRLLEAEGVALPLTDVLTGRIGGDWHGIYALLPGAPGETMPILALLLGIVLYWGGVLDWRPGLAFLAGLALACRALGMPVAFHLAAGSSVFAAVYIVTDPRTLPGSKAGRLAAGFLAGVLNAVVRWHIYYPEGIVPAVLAVNLLSPALDRCAFAGRGAWLQWRARRASAIRPGSQA